MPETKTVRIPLPGDEWAEMADPDDLTGADVEAVLADVDLGDDIDMESMDSRAMGKFMLRLMPQINPGLVAALCREWSLTDGDGEPLPITRATVRVQRVALLRPLYAYVTPARGEVMQAFGVGGGTDPKSAAT